MIVTYRTNKHASFIFDYLTDMQKFASVSPVITKVDEIGHHRYLVCEILKFGPIPFKFKYPLRIELSDKNRTVTMRAVVHKIIQINFIFRIVDAVDYSVIEETIEYQSLLPLGPIFFYVLKKQHETLFENIHALEED